jgi:anti-anti-sigma regulatory factor
MGRRTTQTATSGGSGGRSRLRQQIVLPIRALVRSVRRMARHSGVTLPEPDQASELETEAGPRVVDACGDLRETSVLQEFCRRCESTMDSGPRHLVVDLSHVTRANTKLVAALVLLLRRARVEGVTLDFEVRGPIRQWIALCHVEHLLRETSVPNSSMPCPSRNTTMRDYASGRARSSGPNYANDPEPS